MLTRSLLRTKIAQVVYANTIAENTLQGFDNELNYSLKKSYDLYHLLLLLPYELTFMAKRELDINSGRLVKNNDIVSQLGKFACQTYSQRLFENMDLASYTKNNSLSWFNNYEDELVSIYKRLKATPFFMEYAQSEETGFEVDRQLWKKFFRSKYIYNDEFEDFLEEQSIYLTDDLEVTISFAGKTIARLPEFHSSEYRLLPMYKDEEEQKFVQKLAHSTVLKAMEYDAMISEVASKWDIERITRMDRVLLRMAIAEIKEFPLIPVTVTMNEYIEISKHYSTDKSHIFINGILDRISKTLIEKGLVKAGQD